MRKLILYIATSLDGKIARKDGAIDWLPDPSSEDYGYQEFYDSIDTVIMGYKTYEVCLGFGDWYYKDKTSYVLSKNPDREVLPVVQLVNQDPVAFVRDLKTSEGKDIWVVGGGEVITLLHDAGLIDEYILAYIPIVLGEGVELFPAVTRQENLELAQHAIYENGVVMLYLIKNNNEVS
ncbi:dihydrofolate reductase family protein [Telluribacter humicola]|uniref:dihydrofolate reductase family protein n=1 Tax=Telluribacter humicola TaxID=1720261 RepID=UPI001E3B2389|nr:dihydrofolate reductase family protein [Telluribacter humicola]